jgi:hypothetical protein
MDNKYNLIFIIFFLFYFLMVSFLGRKLKIMSWKEVNLGLNINLLLKINFLL